MFRGQFYKRIWVRKEKPRDEAQEPLTCGRSESMGGHG
jgi:hypothetical protein